jgi:spore maturation protein SpmB
MDYLQLGKTISGGAARGMMADAMSNGNADSFAGRLSCVLQGSSDTTFYVIAVYFGAVGVKNTRYSIGAMYWPICWHHHFYITSLSLLWDICIKKTVPSSTGLL